MYIYILDCTCGLRPRTNSNVFLESGMFERSAFGSDFDSDSDTDCDAVKSGFGGGLLVLVVPTGQAGQGCAGLDWTGHGRSGSFWTAQSWAGLGRAGQGWTRLDRAGQGWTGLGRAGS